MMRSFGMMAMSGVVGLLVLKMLFAFVLPLLAGVFGIALMLLKWGLILGIGYFVWSLFKGRRREAESA